MVRCSRRFLLVGVVLLVPFTCVCGSRYTAGSPHAVHASPRAELRRNALPRRAAALLALAPLLVGAQFQDIEAEFRLMDLDGDGFTSKQEFIFRGRTMIEGGVAKSEADVVRRLRLMADLFDKIDLNRDGKLDLSEAEYFHGIVERSNAVSEGRGDTDFQKVFEIVDANKDGKVSEAELWSICEGDLGADVVSETFAKSDLNGDHSLDKHELHYAAWRLKRLTDDGKSVLRKLVRSLYDLCDRDMDGEITQKELDEAAGALAREEGAPPPDPIKVALEKAQAHFAHYDTNGDGRWTSEEVARFASYVVSPQ